MIRGTEDCSLLQVCHSYPAWQWRIRQISCIFLSGKPDKAFSLSQTDQKREMVRKRITFILLIINLLLALEQVFFI